MRKSACIGLVLVAWLPAFGFERVDAQDVASFVDAFVARADAGRPLESAAFVLVRGQEVLVERGYGHVDAAHSVPVDPETTVFRAASISKVVTATAVLQLVEQGKLRLDADVNTYLQGFALEAGPGRPVTVADLLTHTAGFEDRFLGALSPLGEQVPLAAYFAKRTPHRVVPPGAEISYSNQGLALAGYVVEAVAGVPFEEYVRVHVLLPLGMTHSTFHQPPPAEWSLAGRAASSGRGPRPVVINPYPAGTLVCSVADMGRFLIAQLNGGALPGGRILREDTLEEMQRQHWTALPGMPGVAYGFFESFGHGSRALFHTGDSGHHSILYLIPEQKIGFFLVYAGSDASSAIREKFVDAFLERYDPEPHPFALPAPPADFARRAHEYAGLYQGSQYSRSNLEKVKALLDQVEIVDLRDGTLGVHPPGGGPQVKLVEIGHDLFRSDEGGYLGFRRDGAGHIETLTVSGSVWDPGTWRRIPRYRSGKLHLALLAFCFALIALRALLWPLAGLVRRLRGKAPLRAEGLARTAWKLSALLSWILLLAPVAALLVALATFRPPITNVPVALVVFLTLVLVAFALGLTLVPLGIAAWRRSYWTLPRRIHFSAEALAMLVLGGILYEYNLLGFWF